MKARKLFIIDIQCFHDKRKKIIDNSGFYVLDISSDTSITIVTCVYFELRNIEYNAFFM